MFTSVTVYEWDIVVILIWKDKLISKISPQEGWFNYKNMIFISRLELSVLLGSYAYVFDCEKQKCVSNKI